MVKINGTAVAADGQTLAGLLETSGYDLRLIAVELNGEIVVRDGYGATILADGDELEVVSFVGGG